MRQLREKVRAMRAETEASLGAVTQAASEAKARRGSGGIDEGPVSPRVAPDLGRLQVLAQICFSIQTVCRKT